MSAKKFFEMKQAGTKIAMLTAYDAPMARALAEGGIDILLVGDSVGTNVLGYAGEQEVTMDDMVHHVKAVRRGAPNAYVVADLPYGAVDEIALAVKNSKRLMAAGADMVKFEGARPEILRAIKAENIAVCCHIGLEPQNHAEKRLKGKTADAARQLIADAKLLDEAGMDMIVLELIPEELADMITREIAAPTIGIGAGRGTDGQVLVTTDALGYAAINFRHNKRYAELGAAMRQTAHDYTREVHDGVFPAANNAFKMPAAELQILRAQSPTPDRPGEAPANSAQSEKLPDLAAMA